MSEFQDARTLALDTGEAALLPAMVKTLSGGAALTAARGSMQRLEGSRLSGFVSVQAQTPSSASITPDTFTQPAPARAGSVAGRAVLRQVRWRG